MEIKETQIVITGAISGIRFIAHDTLKTVSSDQQRGKSKEPFRVHPSVDQTMANLPVVTWTRMHADKS